MRNLSLLLLTLVFSALRAQEIKIGEHKLMSVADFGLTTSLRTWSGADCVVTEGKEMKVKEDYMLSSGKRLHCHNEGTEKTYTLVNKKGETLQLQIRKFPDGYAFRYVLPKTQRGEFVTAEATTYHVPATANRWMQIYDGPGYEHFFPLCAGGISPEKPNAEDWGYPALVEVADNQFVLLTEADVLRDHCGSLLHSTDADRNAYNVKMFDNKVPLNGKSWTSPWRVVICGNLATIVESTLVTDVATPATTRDVRFVQPGPCAWIYWAYNHGSRVYSICQQYVDLAVQMGWPYVLIDWEWDVMDGGGIQEIVKYANQKGVKPLMWYNSSVNWIGQGAPGPLYKLNKEEDREREFSMIEKWGVKGVKIDFFTGDDVKTINYYIDLLESAQRHHLLVNFHGGTIPRGWQRTYPNYISSEAVYGAEWYNNNGILTKKAAVHNATLPFTRNVIGPMDYTPGTFTDSQNPHITTHAHELALTILFESGIQHMPDRPEAYLSLPDEVRNLLCSLPTAWDETRLLAGYPGKSAVIARRSGDDWYVAGINGLDEPQEIIIDLASLKSKNKKPLFITDGKKQTEFRIDSRTSVKGRTPVKCEARGGFVIKL